MYITLELEDKDIDIINVCLEESKLNLSKIKQTDTLVLNEAVDNEIRNLNRIKEELINQTRGYIDSL